jgi:hypothetical protein
MNQSLAALVLNGIVTLETAVTHSPNPSDLDLEVRKFLQMSGQGARYGENMADSPADFSKVLELREIRRMYDEMQERYRQEMSDKDALIASLQNELANRNSAPQADTPSSKAIQTERDKLAHQLSFQKQEYESKIEKLQMRIKELNAPGAPVEGGGKSGFFRR